MIHYVLGHAGGGKTIYCLNRFSMLENAVFFTGFRDEFDLKAVSGFDTINLGDKILEKCVVDFLKVYRKNLEDRNSFEKMMENAIGEALNFKKATIFLDEFQLYCTDKVRDLILNAEQDFYIIHQFSKQLSDEYFSSIWKKSDKKYLLDPYQPSEFYKV